MSNANSGNCKLSRSEIARLFNEENSLNEIAVAANIITENGIAFAKEKPKGNCWLFKADQNSFLCPQKRRIATTTEYKNLELFFYLDEIEKVRNKLLFLEEPATAAYTGKDWKLEKKGTLSLKNISNSHSSLEFLQPRDNHNSLLFGNQEYNENLIDESSEIQKDIEIKNLKTQIKELKEQLEKNKESIKEQENINLEPNYQWIEKHLDKYFHEKLPIQLASFNETAKNEIIQQISRKIDQKLSSITKSIEDIKKDFCSLSEQIQQIENKSLKTENNYISSTSRQDYQHKDSISAIADRLIKDLKININRETTEQIKYLQTLIKELENKIVINQLDNKSYLNSEFNNQFCLLKTSIEELKMMFIGLRDKITETNQRLDFISKQQESDSDLGTLDELLFSQNQDISSELTESNNLYLPKKASVSKVVDSQSLIEIYNQDPSSISNSVVKVAVTKESIEQIRAGIKQYPVFKQNINDNYWIVNELQLPDNCYYLVPKANLIISDRIYQTVEDIFICQGYKRRTSNNFELSRPAIVKLSEDSEDEWELVQAGELIFT